MLDSQEKKILRTNSLRGNGDSFFKASFRSDQNEETEPFILSLSTIDTDDNPSTQILKENFQRLKEIKKQYEIVNFVQDKLNEIVTDQSETLTLIDKNLNATILKANSAEKNISKANENTDVSMFTKIVIFLVFYCILCSFVFLI